MDQKLKNYYRHAGAPCVFCGDQAQGDILVLDEVLAVGDEAFQRKCDDYFTKVKKDPNKTVILVTHSMDSVKKYCNKAILIKDGDIIVNGNKEDAANRYTLENLKAEAKKRDAGKKDDDGYAEGLNSRCPILRINPQLHWSAKAVIPSDLMLNMTSTKTRISTWLLHCMIFVVVESRMIRARRH